VGEFLFLVAKVLKHLEACLKFRQQLQVQKTCANKTRTIHVKVRNDEGKLFTEEKILCHHSNEEDLEAENEHAVNEVLLHLIT
jgi:hypothetical protein